MSKIESEAGKKFVYRETNFMVEVIDVVWLDTRDNPGTYLSALYYSNSYDGGVTWSQNEKLSNYFDLIIGFNDVTEVKPDPEGILKILDRWNIKPSDAIFIGDMTTDVDAGKAAKVKMVCVASGLAQKQALLEHKPDILVDNTESLIELFSI